MIAFQRIRDSVPRALALGTALLFSLASATPAALAKGVGTTHHVTIEGMKFTPEAVDAKVGDTIVWENKDIVPHTVTSDAKAKGKALFESGTIAGDATFRLKVRKAGTFSYACRFHPMMKGSIHAQR